MSVVNVEPKRIELGLTDNGHSSLYFPTSSKKISQQHSIKIHFTIDAYEGSSTACADNKTQHSDLIKGKIISHEGSQVAITAITFHKVNVSH